MTTDTTEPAGAAMPIGVRLFLSIAEASHASGRRAAVSEMMLCKNEIVESP